jgi:2-polyprenyl-3-methyl-5-hydroxy-6-metoxy-1,4-benzoquinol methylase
MSSTIADPVAVNEFYSNFWSSEAWGKPEPNDDEQLRAQAIVRFIENSVLPSSGRAGNLKILDLGCGRGWLTSLLSKYGSVLGIDPVPAAIERARVLFPRLEFRAAESGDLVSQGFEGQFDLIVSSEVIEHVVDEQKPEFVSNIHRLLKPGAYAILTTPRGELWELWSRNHDNHQPVEAWISERDLRRLCELNHLRLVDRERVFLPWFSVDWLTRLAGRIRLPALQKRLRDRRAIYQVILLNRIEA